MLYCNPKIIILLSSLFIACACENKPDASLLSEQNIIQSAIRGAKSKGQDLVYRNNGEQLKNISTTITGPNANAWSLRTDAPQTIQENDSITLTVFFQPDPNFIGITVDSLLLGLGEGKQIVYLLRGLSTKALEGKNEPPLADVVATLGYTIDVGWTGLSNTTKAEVQGDELSAALFRKSGSEPAEMIPVARYSPPFQLPYGYYIQEADSIRKYEIGVLADSNNYPEHQTLMPGQKSGSTIFDPGEAMFGFYTTSPSHDAFTEDKWNTLWFSEHVAHAVRIYPIKNAQGKPNSNEYLVCFEEAKNGDYQDYVFVLKNVKAVIN